MKITYLNSKLKDPLMGKWASWVGSRARVLILAVTIRSFFLPASVDAVAIVTAPSHLPPPPHCFCYRRQIGPGGDCSASVVFHAGSFSLSPC